MVIEAFTQSPYTLQLYNKGNFSKNNEVINKQEIFIYRESFKIQ